MCEHVPVCEVVTTRWFAGGELYEEDTEYWYCEKCKELLPAPIEEDEIPF
jgi:methionyl-tRNA synthetase